MDEAIDIPPKRRIDGVTAIMVVVTAVALLGAAWLRTRRPPADEPPAVGAIVPPLRLLDLETSEPVVLVGLRGKVVWVIFWSADSKSARSDLAAIESAWIALKTRGRFAMVPAAVETDKPDRVRAVTAETATKLPVYLASAETRRRFGAGKANPPLHVLIDAEGRIATIARGTSQQTIDRLINQAKKLLDELGPSDDTRFARASLREVD
jgi:hypothetical protein